MSNEIKIESVSIGKLLRNGTISDIYKAIGTKKDGQIDIVVKYYRSEHSSHREKELKYLSTLKHENIVQLIGIAGSQKPNIIMEYADCGSLHNYLYGGQNVRFISGFEKLNWMLQCAKGLTYLHESDPQIFHYDLNSRHLLLFDDFKILKTCGLDNAIESTSFVLDNNSKKFTEKTDIYSFGIIVWETLIRKLSPIYDYQTNNQNENRPMLDDEDHDVIQSLVKLCCDDSPIDRPKMRILVKIINSTHIRIGHVPSKVRYKDLNLTDEIGSGAYSGVYTASWKSKHGLKNIAVKITQYPNNEIDIEKECANMLTLNHKNITRVYGTTNDPRCRPHIVMEYAECGCLQKFLSGNPMNNEITDLQRINLMTQCANGIEYLHDLKPAIFHRDLKPSNLLLFDNYETLKISDFGIDRPLLHRAIPGFGTCHYLPPEVYMSKSYTDKSDVYSFGIIMWEIMSRKTPFYHLEHRHSLPILLKASLGERPEFSDISDMCLRFFIKNCWSQDPDDRPNVKILCKALNTLQRAYQREIPLSKLNALVIDNGFFQ